MSSLKQPKCLFKYIITGDFKMNPDFGTSWHPVVMRKTFQSNLHFNLKFLPSLQFITMNEIINQLMTVFNYITHLAQGKHWKWFYQRNTLENDFNRGIHSKTIQIDMD